MEVKKFECCEKCGKDNCKAPCGKFLNCKENDQLDREFFDHNFRKLTEMKKSATEAEIRYVKLKNKILKEAKVSGILKFQDNKGQSEGKIIQITDYFITVKCNYLKNVNFRDVFTKDVSILG